MKVPRIAPQRGTFWDSTYLFYLDHAVVSEQMIELSALSMDVEPIPERRERLFSIGERRGPAGSAIVRTHGAYVSGLQF